MDSIVHRDLQNYAKWQLLYTWMPYLNDDIVNDYYQFQLLNNPLAQVPSTRNQACMTVLQVVMPYALGRVFAESILPNNSKVTLIHMCVCRYLRMCMFVYVCVCG